MYYILCACSYDMLEKMLSHKKEKNTFIVLSLAKKKKTQQKKTNNNHQKTHVIVDLVFLVDPCCFKGQLYRTMKHMGTRETPPHRSEKVILTGAKDVQSHTVFKSI